MTDWIDDEVDEMQSDEPPRGVSEVEHWQMAAQAWQKQFEEERARERAARRREIGERNRLGKP